jgi:hypothetical protein
VILKFTLDLEDVNLTVLCFSNIVFKKMLVWFLIDEIMNLVINALRLVSFLEMSATRR